MTQYTPETSTEGFTKNNIKRDFKGVHVSKEDLHKLSDLSVSKTKDMKWVHDITLADGNIVYVYTPSQNLNPFYYSSDAPITQVQPPSVEHNSTLESISEDFKLEYTEQGWTSSDTHGRIEVNVHPISDEKLLDHLDELGKLLAHKV